jgi:hypothetical protein
LLSAYLPDAFVIPDSRASDFAFGPESGHRCSATPEFRGMAWVSQFT